MLIDNWKEVTRKSWSARLAAGLGVVAGVVSSHEIIAVGLLNFLPPGIPQLIGAGVVGFLAFGVPIIIARITKQTALPIETVATSKEIAIVSKYTDSPVGFHHPEDGG